MTLEEANDLTYLALAQNLTPASPKLENLSERRNSRTAAMMDYATRGRPGDEELWNRGLVFLMFAFKRSICLFNGGSRPWFMQYFRVITTAFPLLARNSLSRTEKGLAIRSVLQLYSRNNMEGAKCGESTEAQGVTEQSNAPVKTAAQLKKEAARQAKLEKFKKKQEQQAALKDAQAEVACKHSSVHLFGCTRVQQNVPL